MYGSYGQSKKIINLGIYQNPPTIGVEVKVVGVEVEVIGFEVVGIDVVGVDVVGVWSCRGRGRRRRCRRRGRRPRQPHTLSASNLDTDRVQK